jgi:hypothetical protein
MRLGISLRRIIIYEVYVDLIVVSTCCVVLTAVARVLSVFPTASPGTSHLCDHFFSLMVLRRSIEYLTPVVFHTACDWRRAASPSPSNKSMHCRPHGDRRTTTLHTLIHYLKVVYPYVAVATCAPSCFGHRKSTYRVALCDISGAPPRNRLDRRS